MNVEYNELWVVTYLNGQTGEECSINTITIVNEGWNSGECSHDRSIRWCARKHNRDVNCQLLLPITTIQISNIKARLCLTFIHTTFIVPSKTWKLDQTKNSFHPVLSLRDYKKCLTKFYQNKDKKFVCERQIKLNIEK